MWLERTLAHQVLPKLAREAKSQSLAALFEEHLQETFGHVANAERAFHLAAAEVSSNLDQAAERLFAQHDELAGSIVEDVLRDVFHAGGAVMTEHYELARYDALLALTPVLGLDEAHDLLERNRREDADALGKAQDALRRLAGALE